MDVKEPREPSAERCSPPTGRLSASGADAPRNDRVNGFPNDIINAINLAADAANEVEGLVRHLDGIIQQVSASDISALHLESLEREARETARALATRRLAPLEVGISAPLEGPIRSELESSLEKSRQFLDTGRATSEFDIGEINLSTPASIEQTQASISTARRRLDEMRAHLEESRSVLRRVFAAEVAAENSRAATATIRDLDQAVELAARTGTSLLGNHTAALGAFSKLSDGSLKTLL